MIRRRKYIESRGRAKTPALRAAFCVPCNVERPFHFSRCTVCKAKLPAISKFGNVPTVVDGIRFHSKREAARYVELRWLESQGHIAELERQVKFDLDVNGVHVCRYIADFRYLENGQRIVEDSKGARTDVYSMKAKLMLACHGIKVKET